MEFRPASDCSLLVYFGREISLDANRKVIGLLQELEQARLRGIRNLHPGYASLLIVFDPLQLDHASVEGEIRRLPGRAPACEAKQIEIPVRYDGPDLPEVARMHHMSVSEVVSRHSASSYHVYFLGFIPGFAYLGGLPEELATPRLHSPRKSVPAGSVGIAGNHTGIYPFVTPGGWRLIGATPLQMFQNGRSLLSPGDHVRFVPLY